jgi:hypothetical protein
MTGRNLHKMSDMIYTVRFLWMCYKAWKGTEKLSYWAIRNSYGIPQVSIAIGKDREAWRVSQFAIDSLTRI